MQKGSLAVVLTFVLGHAYAQQSLSPLSIEKIMRDPKWIGTSPSGMQWNYDGSTLYFNWNPDKKVSDSLYYITIEKRAPQKATAAQKKNILDFNALTYSSSRNAYTYEKDGDVFLTDIKSKKTQQITTTTDYETNPVFAFNDSRIVYRRSQNLYAWNISSGEIMQLTNFQKGEALPETKEKLNTQEEWLKDDQLRWINVLKKRKEKKDAIDADKKNTEKKNNKPIYTGGKTIAGLQISSTGRFISYTLIQQSKESKSTFIPNYVTESGFTESIPGRTKVGETLNNESLFVYDREMDTVIAVKTDSIPGITDLPDYVKDYPALLEEKKKSKIPRAVSVNSVRWSPQGMYAVVDLESQDNKDRWLMRLERQPANSFY